MDNRQVAAVFAEMADLSELKGDNPFKVRAFRRMAQAFGELAEPLSALLASGALERLPGIGEGALHRVTELLETGRCADHEALRAEVPAGLLDLLQVEGLGPKTVRLLYDTLGVTSVDALEAAARAGQLAALPRLGQKSQERILKGIEAWRRHRGRTPIGEAMPLGRALLEALRAFPEVERADLAGSLRRGRETVGDLDLLAASQRPEAVMARFASLPEVAEVLARGETKCSVRLGAGLQVDLRVLPPESYGAGLHYFTGSQQHNIAVRDRGKRRGLRVSEYGVFKEAGEARLCGVTEEEVFAAVGLPFIPPELREDRGELEAAEQGRLPALLEERDLLGDLHAHTSYSDGSGSIEEMARAAHAAGLRYLAITDHSKSLTIARGLDEARLEEQVRELRRVEEQLGTVRLLAGIEVDILADGTLDLEAKALRGLEWVVASVHSHFQMTAQDMTARIVRAMETGLVDCVGHPSGRLLGQRDAYPVDLDALLRAAKRTHVALELNAHPTRLDLDAAHCRQARELGVPVVVNTDAHAPTHLGRWGYGVLTARRGWLEARHVLNTKPAAAIERRRRERLGRQP
ncbi:MAG: DNA polymerase/3'-5' exonuclease PolX [Deltaproteobacteria bacterium]|nr:DNA polymerase/3'-5' exonuclease PolX [Deltaproteobacteria bacterium]